MLENASQGIACDFDASQVLWNVPSWVCSSAVCGWAFRHSQYPDLEVGSLVGTLQRIQFIVGLALSVYTLH